MSNLKTNEDCKDWSLEDKIRFGLNPRATPTERKKFILEIEHIIHVSCLNGSTKTKWIFPKWLSDWDLCNLTKIYQYKGFQINIINNHMIIEW